MIIRINEVNGQAATAGTSVTPTTSANYQVGDLVVASLFVLNKSSTNPQLNATIRDNNFGGNFPWFGPIDHPTAAMRTWFGIGIVTSQINSGTNVGLSWSTSATGRYGTLTCFRSDEGFNTLTPDDIETATATSATSISGANLDPLGSTGLGFCIVCRNVNSSMSPVTGWTEIRDAGNTAPMRIQTMESFRTTSAAYAPGSGSFTSSNVTLIAFHLATGAAGTVYEREITVETIATASVVKSVLIPRSITTSTSVSAKRDTAKTITAQASSAVVMVKRAAKTLTAEAASAVSAAASRVLLKTIEVTATTTASATRQARKTLAAAATSDVVVARQTRKVIGATASASVAATKRAAKTLSATATASVAVVKRARLILGAAATTLASLSSLVNGQEPLTAGASIDTRMSSTNTLQGREVATYVVSTRISTTTAVTSRTIEGYSVDTRMRG